VVVVCLFGQRAQSLLRQLPSSTVAKLAVRDSQNTKLSKDAKAGLVRASTIFLFYLSSAYDNVVGLGLPLFCHGARDDTGPLFA